MQKLRRLRILGSQLVIASLLLVLFEISIRIFSPQVNNTIFVNGTTLAKRDSTLGHVLNPGSITRQRFTEFDVTYSISQEGFHQPYLIAKDTLKPKILFVGDSYTFGMGTAFSESYVGLLSKRFEENFVAINAGVLGYHTKQELEVVTRLIEQKPSLICLEIVSNDFQQMGGMHFDAATSLSDTGIRPTEQQLWKLQSVDFVKRLAIQNDRLYYALSKSANEKFETIIINHLDTVAATVVRIAEICNAHDTKLLVFFYPSKFMVTRGLFEARPSKALVAIDTRMKAIANAFHFTYANPTEAIAEDYSIKKIDHHYRMDGHCTIHGNAFLAGWLAPIIEQNLVKPEIN